MDGVRAYWNGKEILSRQGKEMNCPKWWMEELPVGVKLDGELWMGRGSFGKLQALLHVSLDQTESWSQWKEVKYVVFDLVDGELLYEERMERLRRLNLPKHVSVVEVERCLGKDHLQERLEWIVKNDGEGIVLTKPQTKYVGERTRSRLKVKVRE